MAGFTLGGGRGAAGDEDQRLPPDSLLLYGASSSSRGEEISYARGFELWQQQQQQRHHHHHLSPAGLLAFSDEPLAITAGRGAGMGRDGGGAGGGGVSCQDCGNQAKKDCAHLRCRTCCKSRNFDCPTHVKSTWVPASKRRERQQQLAAAASLHRPRPAAPLPAGEPSKRLREIPPLACTRLPSPGGTMEGTGAFPPEVSSAAVFRCVRVSPVDDANDEFAYQTAVSIGGHVFKGILYDVGPDMQPAARQVPGAGLTSAAGASASSSAPSTMAFMDPASIYQAPMPINSFMAGTQFFPHHPRPH